MRMRCGAFRPMSARSKKSRESSGSESVSAVLAALITTTRTSRRQYREHEPERSLQVAIQHRQSWKALVTGGAPGNTKSSVV